MLTKEEQESAAEFNLPLDSDTPDWWDTAFPWKTGPPSSAPASHWWSCRPASAHLETTSGLFGSAGSPLKYRTTTHTHTQWRMHETGDHIWNKIHPSFLPCLFLYYEQDWAEGMQFGSVDILSTVREEHDNESYLGSDLMFSDRWIKIHFIKSQIHVTIHLKMQCLPPVAAAKTLQSLQWLR